MMQESFAQKQLYELFVVATLEEGLNIWGGGGGCFYSAQFLARLGDRSPILHTPLC